MIEIVVIAALGAVWGWFVLNDPKAPRFIVGLGNLLRKLPKGEKLVGCPWCIGAWFSIIAVVLQEWALGVLDPVLTPIHALAAAGLCGIIGGFIADDGEPN